MSINEIAKLILNLRENRMTGFIMAGVVREELGFDGYSEALRRRWIEPDMEQSGMVTISNNLNTVAEIRQLAAECKSNCGTCGKAECKCEGRCDSCKGEKCTCESKQEPLSETAHFFAQAHAFRRNAAVGENEVVGQPGAPVADPAASAAPVAEPWSPEDEEFYGSRRGDLRRHFNSIHAGKSADDIESEWGKFEPQLRGHVHKNFFHPSGPMHSAYRRLRGQSAPPMGAPAPQAARPDPGLGVNDSMEVVAAKLCESILGVSPTDAHTVSGSHAFRGQRIQEVATLGLGRTGDAPTTPVPGLGAQSAAPTQRTAPQAQPAADPSRPQPVGIGQDVAVVENGKQYVGKVSRTLPDGKYEISFAGEQPPVRRSYDKTEVTSSPAGVK